ncbi:TPA: DUF551 domain-containing protein, partial [Klebsiella pneumoniae]|nr:DUF551 domain-containing protein [Klebsiella pneumoniae]
NFEGEQNTQPLSEAERAEPQERRKAERDTEPYGFTDGDRRGMIYKPEHADRLSEPVPVYRHAQPVPRVPNGYVMVPVKPTREILDEFDSIIDYGAEDSEDAWRRLLAAAPQSPGSDPATVPGKWISVSERLPEAGVKVLCFPLEDEPIHAVFNGQLWLQDVSWSGSEEPIDNVIPVPVTHWMPIPAAPQEVKGE